MGAGAIDDPLGAARRRLVWLLAAAVAVSIVHYADNTLNFADYPQPASGPAPSQALVGLSWFAFTATGIAGFALFARRRVRAAGALLAVYSLSGLIGAAHYTVPGATGMPAWRQAHIVADIACGAAMAAFALWCLLRARQPHVLRR